LSRSTILFIDEQDTSKVEIIDIYKENFIINLVVYSLQKY
jgi:hypothetical protein